MTQDNETQPGVRIDASLWNEFREDIKQRRGAVRGHLRTELENAIRSYIEASKGGDITDRLRRIETQLDEVGEGVGDLLEQQERKKKKDSGVSSRVENRLEKITSHIEREAGEADKIHESVINHAIEEHAGSSRPTLERYKEMLEQRHIAHEWPTEQSNTWWLDSEQFVQVCETTFPEQSDDLAVRYGEEWWDEQCQDDSLPGRGVQ